MASRCSRIFQKSFNSTPKSAISKPAASALDRSTTMSFRRSSVSSKSVVSPLRRYFLSRSRAELGGVASMLPLHSAVATARMTSCLSSTSRSCRALSQGTLCCTSPDLYSTIAYPSISFRAPKEAPESVTKSCLFANHTVVWELGLSGPR